MSFDLETAATAENLRRIAIDPVSRVEGHGKVTLLLDENNQVQQACSMPLTKCPAATFSSIFRPSMSVQKS